MVQLIYKLTLSEEALAMRLSCQEHLSSKPEKNCLIKLRSLLSVFPYYSRRERKLFLTFQYSASKSKLLSVIGLQTLQSHQFILIPKFVAILIASKEQCNIARHFFHSSNYQTSITDPTTLVSFI